MACTVIDWAMQAFGGAGITPADYGLAKASANARLLRLADGPDEVHRNQIARLDLKTLPQHGERAGRQRLRATARRGARPQYTGPASSSRRCARGGAGGGTGSPPSSRRIVVSSSAARAISSSSVPRSTNVVPKLPSRTKG